MVLLVFTHFLAGSDLNVALFKQVSRSKYFPARLLWQSFENENSKTNKLRYKSDKYGYILRYIVLPYLVISLSTDACTNAQKLCC